MLNNITKTRYIADRDLWVLAIGRNPQDHVTLRPHVKYIGNMHGNEVHLYHSIAIFFVTRVHFVSIHKIGNFKPNWDNCQRGCITLQVDVLCITQLSIFQLANH